MVNMRITGITSPPGHHVFGYYDKEQFDLSGRYVLAQRVDFFDHPPDGEEQAEVGMIDLEDGLRFNPIGTTHAWCWQQGAMLQWVPGRTVETQQVIYNDRIGDRFVSVIYDLKSGKKRTLPRPVYTLSNDGREALSLNFSRNAVTRPGYGYPGLRDRWADDPCPEEDGVYRMDLETGNHRLVVSTAEAAGAGTGRDVPGAVHWVNHLLFRPDDKRFILLHRWHRPDRGGFQTDVLTAAREGGSLHRAPLEGGSHFIWYDGETLLIWATTDEHGPAYYLYRDQSGEPVPFAAGVLTRNGHCSVSHDGEWVLTDEYPDDRGEQPLILYHPSSERRFDIGRFGTAATARGEIRCDLHPRWSRDDRRVCFDSTHEGTRQMYIADVGSLTAGLEG